MSKKRKRKVRRCNTIKHTAHLSPSGRWSHCSIVSILLSKGMALEHTHTHTMKTTIYDVCTVSSWLITWSSSLPCWAPVRWSRAPSHLWFRSVTHARRCWTPSLCLQRSVRFASLSCENLSLAELKPDGVLCERIRLSFSLFLSSVLLKVSLCSCTRSGFTEPPPNN